MSRVIPAIPDTPVESQTKPSRFVSTTKVARRLDISTNTVRALIADGQLTGYQIGRLVKLDWNEVEAFIAKAASQKVDASRPE